MKSLPKNLKNKLVLLRSDINSDLKGKKVQDSPRIKAAADTIKLLKSRGSRIVIIAHQGNPGKSDFISLKQHAKLLSKYSKVSFKKSLTHEQLMNIKPKEAVLLDNIRFLDDEFKPKKKSNVILSLAKHFDLFVNDAFSVCHRDHTSISKIPLFIQSFPGPNLQKEVDALKKIVLEDTLYVLGGAKPESDIKLLNGKNKVLTTGFFGQLCIISKGKDFGYQNSFLKKNTLVRCNYKRFLRKLFSKQKNVWTPIDFAVSIRGERKEFPLTSFPNDYQIDDIGSQTVERYKKLISRAKSIYMKGPAGNSLDPKFSKGTIDLLKAIGESKAFSVIGGGHLSQTMEKYKIPKKNFDHVSLSGGALLAFIAGEKLPGLEALGFYQ